MGKLRLPVWLFDTGKRRLPMPPAVSNYVTGSTDFRRMDRSRIRPAFVYTDSRSHSDAEILQP